MIGRFLFRRRGSAQFAIPRPLFQGCFGDAFCDVSVLKLWLAIFWQFFHCSQKILSDNEFQAEIEFQIKLVSNNSICILFHFQRKIFQSRKLSFPLMQKAFIAKVRLFQRQPLIFQRNFRARHQHSNNSNERMNLRGLDNSNSHTVTAIVTVAQRLSSFAAQWCSKFHCSTVAEFFPYLNGLPL